MTFIGDALRNPLNTPDGIKSGDATNNVDTNKTQGIRQNGTTTTWDDLRFPSSNVKAIPGKEAKDQAYKGSIIMKFEDGADQGIAFVVQLPHDYKFGSDLRPHMHMTLPVAGSSAGVENIKFDMTYSIANLADAFPAESTLTITSDVQNTAADLHGLVPLGTIDGSAIDDISTMILCSLTRDVSVADNFTEDIYLLEIDIHYQRDSLGSDEEYTKT